MNYALVTGTNKGMGRSISEQLMRSGYFVFLLDIEFNEIKNDSKFLTKDNHQFIKVDLSSYDCIEVVEKEVKSRTNKIDLIIFNAGFTDRSPFPEINPENWVKIQNIFLNIPVFILQKLNPIISSGGNIIFMGS